MGLAIRSTGLREDCGVRTNSCWPGLPLLAATQSTARPRHREFRGPSVACRSRGVCTAADPVSRFRAVLFVSGPPISGRIEEPRSGSQSSTHRLLPIVERSGSRPTVLLNGQTASGSFGNLARSQERGGPPVASDGLLQRPLTAGLVAPRRCVNRLTAELTSSPFRSHLSVADSLRRPHTMTWTIRNAHPDSGSSWRFGTSNRSLRSHHPVPSVDSWARPMAPCRAPSPRCQWSIYAGRRACNDRPRANAGAYQRKTVQLVHRAEHQENLVVGFSLQCPQVRDRASRDQTLVSAGPARNARQLAAMSR